MADVQEASLYDRDFYLWALDQARVVRDLRDAAARPGSNYPAALQALDWDNLIEELEGLARGVRSELRNRLHTIIEHLVKLELSPAADPRPGWRTTVTRSRIEIEDLIQDNPSLRREIPEILEGRTTAKTASFILDELVERGEVARGTQAPSYTAAQILDDWWPPQTDQTP